MGEVEFNLNLGDSLPYLDQKVRALFGKDEATLAANSWLRNLQATAIAQTQHVHCVGMHEPVPFDKIYQPTRLRMKRIRRASGNFTHQNRASRSIARGKADEEDSVTLEQFLSIDEDAIIYAGPGWGKTTFLHYIFRAAMGDQHVLPILITLRRPTALDDLANVIDKARIIQKKQSKDKILLLVDGYDEVTIAQRRQVSELLLSYKGLGVGRYYLSCREYYEVLLLNASQVRIDKFTKQDKYAFAKAFLSASGSRLNPIGVVNELEDRGFTEFLSHPLLLALACIVKTSSSSIQPRSAIRLLERALDVLCYRWDEQKGIDRQSTTQLDGKDRLQVLRRIAYIAKSSHIPQSKAEMLARTELARLTFDRVDPRQVLMETARFYGILVPSDDGWEFVHRTIHDFLAAQYWVETGEFANLKRYEWNCRTAYAACRMSDSTEVIESALGSENGLPTVAEILSNAPSFDMSRIAAAILRYYKRPGRAMNAGGSNKHVVTGKLESDFVRLSNTRFLNCLIEVCCENRTAVTDVIVGYCLLEISERKQKLDFASYDKAIAAYQSDEISFNLVGEGQVRLAALAPGRTI